MTNGEFLKLLLDNYPGKLPVLLEGHFADDKKKARRFIEIHGRTDCLIYDKPAIIRVPVERIDLSTIDGARDFDGRWLITKT